MKIAANAVKSFVLTTILACSLATPVLAEKDQLVVLQTTKGPIRMRIFYSVVPYTAGNFLDLVESGFYNGLTFHRVENWVVQGGDPNGDGSGNATDPNTGQPHFIRLETNPNLNHNQAGMVAMARSNSPNSASCQFYITKSAAPWCNGKYAVFGRVIGSMDAVYNMQRGDRILSATIVQPQSNTPPPSDSSSQSSAEPSDSGKRSKPKDSGF